MPPKSLASELGFKDVEPVESAGPKRPHVYCLLCGWEQIAHRYLVRLPMIRILVGGADSVPEITRFEAIVNDVFRAHGYRTSLTRATKDKGADIVLLSRDGNNIEGIVECKRYAETRKIGVELVKQLMGTESGLFSYVK